MSGGISATTVLAAAAVAGTAYTIYNGEEQARKQSEAQGQARANAAKAEKAADENINRTNQKRPDTAAILSAAQQAGKGASASTMLTGPQGVDPSALQLGKNTLLGG